MFNIKIAELNILIDNKYPALERMCRDYICQDDKVDFAVSVSNEEIEAECDMSESVLGHRVSPSYAESICVYRDICRQLPNYDAFLFHSSVVECDGYAYAFSAKSGTGKSTHTALWIEHFGDRARIINGDKPIFRFVNGQLRAYGTPWCGKEGLNVNADAPLSAICFIERGSKNEISRIDESDAVVRMFSQILIPPEEADIDILFPLLEKMLISLPCFVLKCTISDEAVTVAYNAFRQNNP